METRRLARKVKCKKKDTKVDKGGQANVCTGPHVPSLFGEAVTGGRHLDGRLLYPLKSKHGVSKRERIYWTILFFSLIKKLYFESKVQKLL